MFPHVFVICSPFNKFAYHLSPPLIPFRKKKKTKQNKTKENKTKKKRKKTPKAKHMKEENRLYVTFNLCDTSSQAFEQNSQSIRVGWALELALTG